MTRHPLSLSDLPYEVEKRRVVMHEGAEHFLEVEHDRASNKLYVVVDEVAYLFEPIRPDARAPAALRTTSRLESEDRNVPQRISYTEGISIANRLIELLEPHCKRIVIAGSLRRDRKTVGDVEIVCEPTYPLDLLGERNRDLPHDVARALEGADFVIPRTRASGSRIAWKERFFAGVVDAVPVDVFCVLPPAQYGAILAIRTGPAGYSKWLTTVARDRGMRFHEGGIWRGAGALELPDEASVFEALGLEYVEPSHRAPPGY